ncbi:MAG TPA: hypothetical protein VID20_06550 [Sphingomicrobium sp.]|jgi:hypothetical protein
MKFALSAALAAGLLVAGLSSAGAVTAPPAPHSQWDGVIQVRDDCGRGWHRNFRGHCVPNNDADSYWHRRHHERNDWDGCGRYHHRNRFGRCVPNY